MPKSSYFRTHPGLGICSPRPRGGRVLKKNKKLRKRERRKEREAHREKENPSREPMTAPLEFSPLHPRKGM